MVFLAAVWLAVGHVTPGRETGNWPGAEKIKFRLNNIRADGLRGSPDGLVAVAYEFCIPADEGVYEEVLRIDPGIQIYAASPGRIACADNQTLSIGGTNQPHWRAVLQELASLSYIVEIRECFFE